MREKNRSCKQEKNPFVYYSFCFFDVIFDSSFFLLPIQEYYLKNDYREQALNAGN